MSERDTLREGQRLDGRYHLVERLTDWGVGECWRARDVEAHTRVVVKLLPPLAPSDARRTSELQSLVRRLVKFRHRGVAATLASGVFEGRPYLVLEHLDGVSLGAAFSRARTASRLLEPGMLVNLFDRTLEALTAAHGDARPLVHGALTPASVLAALVDGRLVVRVLDFGLVTVFGPRLRDRAAGDYVAPELDDDPERVTPACDVFALGAMLTEAVTDRRTASGGITATVGGLSAVATRREDMPNALLGVASRAMRVDPDGRFASAAAMHDAFNAAWGAHPDSHDDAPALDTAPAVSWERYADEALAAPASAPPADLFDARAVTPVFAPAPMPPLSVPSPSLPSPAAPPALALDAATLVATPHDAPALDAATLVATPHAAPATFDASIFAAQSAPAAQFTPRAKPAPIATPSPIATPAPPVRARSPVAFVVAVLAALVAALAWRFVR
jgi:eukaryotic-like serine/threonine-protein kinase